MRGFSGYSQSCASFNPDNPASDNCTLLFGWPRVTMDGQTERQRGSMKGEIHEGPGLTYLTVLPDDYDPEASYPLVIMLHGFGANMHDLAGLAPAINPTGYVYACPNAPIPFNLGLGARWLRVDDAPRAAQLRRRSPTRNRCWPVSSTRLWRGSTWSRATACCWASRKAEA